MAGQEARKPGPAARHLTIKALEINYTQKRQVAKCKCLKSKAQNADEFECKKGQITEREVRQTRQVRQARQVRQVSPGRPAKC